MPNLYKDIPDCEIEGCDEAGIYYLMPNPTLEGENGLLGGKSICPKHLGQLESSTQP